MNVHALTGRSLSDISLVVGHSHWGHGDPEGIAHWDGTEWAWITTIRGGWTSRAALSSDTLLILDTDGYVRERKGPNQCSIIKEPEIEVMSARGRCSLSPGFFDILPMGPEQFAIAGDEGLIFRRDKDAWVHLETGVDKTVRRLILVQGDILAFGDRVFAKVRRNEVILLNTDVPNFIDASIVGNTIWAVSCDYHGEGQLWRIVADSICHVSDIPEPVNVCGLPSDQALVGTQSHGVLLSDGSRLTSVLDVPTGQAHLVDGIAVFSSVYNNDRLFVYEGNERWESIRIDIDFAPIGPPFNGVLR